MGEDKPYCFNCGEMFETEDEADDAYCSGCDQHVCDDCDETGPWGKHEPEQHLEEEEE